MLSGGGRTNFIYSIRRCRGATKEIRNGMVGRSIATVLLDGSYRGERGGGEAFIRNVWVCSSMHSDELKRMDKRIYSLLKNKSYRILMLKHLRRSCLFPLFAYAHRCN